MAKAKKKDRVFVDKPGRHYRRTYSLGEVRAAIAVLVGLAGVLGWVLYKGQQPNPSLFSASADGLVRRDKKPVDRGPLPEGLAPDGWKERGVSSFGKDNLYVKINGREGFYKSFGFEMLYFVTFIDESEPTRAIDIELFDLGEAQNALGCFAAEAPKDARPTLAEGGLTRADRNAVFFTRGRYYARLLGGEESAPIKAALAVLRERLAAALPAQALPWSYGLFVGGLQVPPAKISYEKENAFSFAFGERVYVGVLEDGETEAFVTVTDSDEAARTLADRYVNGFASLGEKVSGPSGQPWVKDEFLSRMSTASADGRFVLGVRMAADIDAGETLLKSLRAAVGGLSEAERARAFASVSAPPEEDESPPGAPPAESGGGEYEGESEGAAEGYEE